jgi:GT2 family glycosyltransferase
MKLFIVVAVFNKVQNTLQFIELLGNQTYRDFEIVIVDDGSKDGTAEIVKEKFPGIHIVKGSGNWWWTRSINEGIIYAQAHGAEYILIQNNDTWFEPDYLSKLMAAASQVPEAIIGSLDITFEEPKRIFFSGVKQMIWWKAKGILYHKGYPEYDTSLTGLHPTVALNGRGTLIPMNVIDKIGFLDAKNLPQYASDFDLILRAHRMGVPCYISWDAVVYSFVGDTGAGKPYIYQSWTTYLKSFFNPYAQTSLRTWFNYCSPLPPACN